MTIEEAKVWCKTLAYALQAGGKELDATAVDVLLAAYAAREKLQPYVRHAAICNISMGISAGCDCGLTQLLSGTDSHTP